MPDGNPQDTNDRSYMTAALGGSDDLVRLLLDSAGEGIYGTDLDGNCTFANPACLKLLGFESNADLLGKNVHNLVHHTRPNGEPYPIEECRIYRAFRESEGAHVADEVMFRTDGTRFPAEYSSYPVLRGGELLGCVVTFVDITERLEVQEELQEAEQLVRSLLNSSGEGIYGTDMEGNCTFANPACLKLLGFESDADLLGKNVHDLVHHTRPNGEPYPIEECRIYSAFRAGEGTHIADEVMFRTDGSSFPAEYWSYPVLRDGTLTGCVVTFVDIAERLQMEEELRQTEKMAALGKLSSGLAHELNNPAAAAGRASSQLVESLGRLQEATLELTRAGIDHEVLASLIKLDEELQRRSLANIQLSTLEASDLEDEIIRWLEANGVTDAWEAAATLVAAGMQSADLDNMASTLPAHALGQAAGWLCRSCTAQDLAREVVSSSQRISTLVNATKSFSYMDQDSIQTVDIHQGIEDTITVLGEKLRNGINVVRKFDQSLPRVQVRASELNQVWMNLLDNAADALRGQGTVTIRTYRHEDKLAVEIADDGPGVPDDIQPRVFDPFFTTKDVGEGAGLGLDVARRIVTTRCNGNIGLRCQPGETIFWVYLPVV